MVFFLCTFWKKNIKSIIVKMKIQNINHNEILRKYATFIK